LINPKAKLDLPRIRLPSIKNKTETIEELTILVGFLMVVYGLYSIYPPLMWILAGLWLMFPGKRR
jgi:hypothetical protein